MMSGQEPRSMSITQGGDGTPFLRDEGELVPIFLSGVELPDFLRSLGEMYSMDSLASKKALATLDSLST